jgi:hypothetical protein
LRLPSKILLIGSGQPTARGSENLALMFPSKEV